jgi:hypothetical protein
MTFRFGRPMRQSGKPIGLSRAKLAKDAKLKDENYFSGLRGKTLAILACFARANPSFDGEWLVLDGATDWE